MSLLKAFLMEQQKIMYATIKGSLTNTDGVFSGFSTSNYLEVQGLYDLSQPFEIKTKIHLNSNPNASSFIRILGSSTTGYAVIMISQAFAIGAYIGADDGTTIFGANATPNNIIPINKDIFIRFVFTGTEYDLYVSVDNIEKKYLIATTSKVIGNNKYIILGANPTASQSFAVGTIDLNQTNIKLGSTKYKLQAVVGYTVVGSPTITDGVVSGFSDSNYLNLPLQNEETDIEMKFKVVTNLDTSSGQYFFAWWTNVNGSNRSCGLYINGSKYGCIVRDIGDINYQITGGSIQPNTTYFFKIVFKKSDKIFKMGISTDDVTYTFEIERELTHNLSPMNKAIDIGRAIPSNYYWKGYIDLNNIYIKLNNKLWFNGQQA